MLDQVANATPFHKSFKGVTAQWWDTLPAEYVELTVLNGRILLPHTFFQIGDEYVQKHIDTMHQEVRYRRIEVLNGRTKRDGTVSHYRNFRDEHHRQFQVAALLPC
jgi:hypothetical protein